MGEDFTDCSFIFLYILCTMSIREVRREGGRERGGRGEGGRGEGGRERGGRKGREGGRKGRREGEGEGERGGRAGEKGAREDRLKWVRLMKFSLFAECSKVAGI